MALIPGVTPAGRYPAPFVPGARTFLPGDLSAVAGAAVRPTDLQAMELPCAGVKAVAKRCLTPFRRRKRPVSFEQGLNAVWKPRIRGRLNRRPRPQHPCHHGPQAIGEKGGTFGVCLADHRLLRVRVKKQSRVAHGLSPT